MVRFLVAAAALLLGAVPAAAQLTPITYTANRIVGSTPVQLSITTDGTVGQLTSANIVSWTFSYSIGGGSTYIGQSSSPGAITATSVQGYSPGYGTVISPLTASVSSLSYDFDLYGANFFLFDPESNAAYEIDNGVRYPPNYSGEMIALNGDASYYSGVQIIAESGLPEPGAWVMMIGGFAAAGAAMRRRRRVALA